VLVAEQRGVGMDVNHWHERNLTASTRVRIARPCEVFARQRQIVHQGKIA
jgi:hypothetical protein